MPNVTEVRLWLRNNEHCLVTLQRFSELHLQDETVRIPWPTLRVLVLYYVDFSDERLVATLHRILKQRDEMGCARLSRLVLHSQRPLTDRQQEAALILSDIIDEVVILFGDISTL